MPSSRLHAIFLFSFFFFNDTATTEIYTLSLHDALPISCDALGCPFRGRASNRRRAPSRRPTSAPPARGAPPERQDRKSTRLNSSHVEISYAVFCLKKKKRNERPSADEALNVDYELEAML